MWRGHQLLKASTECCLYAYDVGGSSERVPPLPQLVRWHSEWLCLSCQAWPGSCSKLRDPSTQTLNPLPGLCFSKLPMFFFSLRCVFYSLAPLALPSHNHAAASNISGPLPIFRFQLSHSFLPNKPNKHELNNCRW